ncbi:MAG: peptide deformylase [Hyphomicrobiales bacterium]|nr:peptide deformylase [Hyphomicrobiales bacterium]
MQFDEAKLRATVLYTFAHSDPAKLGAVKLHKVLYFTDMLHYLRAGSPATGATYRKNRFGPTCQELSPLLHQLAAEGAIEIRESEYFGYLKKEYDAKEAPQVDRLNRHEVSLLEDVIEFVCNDNTAKTISDFSHNRAWERAEFGDILSYSSAFLLLARHAPLESSEWKSEDAAERARSLFEGIPFGDFRSRAIVKLPNKLLRSVSQRVGRIDEGVRRLIFEMFETMYEAPGIGLAAIQVGVPKRVITMDVAKKGEPMNPQVFVDPEIQWRSSEFASYEEGCLSIPEYYEEVERPARVRVAFTDRDGQRREIDADGMLATCLQHEIDHLNGVLFIDHISKLKRDRVLKKFAKVAKRAAEG